MKKMIIVAYAIIFSTHLLSMNPTAENPSRASLAFTGIKNGTQASALTTAVILTPFLRQKYSIKIGSKIIQKTNWGETIKVLGLSSTFSGIIGGISGAGLSLTSNNEETVIRRAQVAGTFTGALMGMGTHCLALTATALEEFATWIIR